jgi:hypothetical protein
VGIKMPRKNSKKKNKPKEQKKRDPFIWIGGMSLILLVAIFTGVYHLSKDEKGKDFFGSPIASARSYRGEVISAADVEPVIENGQIKIPFEEIDKNNMVHYEIENNAGQLVPMMAYITPSGRLFAGSSFCEPCHSRKYDLAGDTLVCDVCGTTYNIENHKFIKGSQSCGALPPIYMNPRVEEGMMILEHETVLNWRRRI